MDTTSFYFEIDDIKWKHRYKDEISEKLTDKTPSEKFKFRLNKIGEKVVPFWLTNTVFFRKMAL